VIRTGESDGGRGALRLRSDAKYRYTALMRAWRAIGLRSQSRGVHRGTPLGRRQQDNEIRASGSPIGSAGIS
jgi:hypothetical protein